MQAFLDPKIHEIARKLNLSAEEAGKLDADTFMEIKNDPTLSASEKEAMYREIYNKARSH